MGTVTDQVMPHCPSNAVYIVTDMGESLKSNQVLITHNGVYLSVDDQRELMKENKGEISELELSLICIIFY